jgi:hypothetical protein
MNENKLSVMQNCGLRWQYYPVGKKIHWTAMQSHIAKESYTMKSVIKYVGLDVSKEKIAVAVANEGREPAHFVGMFPHTEKAVRKLIQMLTPNSRSKLPGSSCAT